MKQATMQGAGVITKLPLGSGEKGAITLSTEPKEDPTLFHWSDVLLGERVNRVHPLALIARAFSLLDAISTRAVRHGMDRSDTIQEIRFALETLIRDGEFHTAGQFLTSLETAIPTDERERWPLSEALSQQ